jgi:uncharacterized repeat protein (TIGR04076 family)
MQDVRISVHRHEGCPYTKPGDSFVVRGTKVHHPPGQGICFYALAAMMPHLTLLQVDPGSNDHEALEMCEFQCPHKHVVYRAERLGATDERSW